MHRLARFAVAAVAAVAMIPGAAHADHCAGDVTVAGDIYVEVRGEVTDGSIWVYQESNGLAGLQRGGVTELSDDSDCQDVDGAGNAIPADTLIL